MLDAVVIKASYGDVKINAIAHISVMDSQTIKVEPWDKKENKHITAAIYDANLGLTPTNEGDYVMVKIPEITKE
ncbi:MAG: ribosome-recycling factor [bacterium]|nr:ribosome-recycling factor [bacterium]